MEIKYEAVFGDQALFDGCDENAVVVIDDMTGTKKSSKIEFFADCKLNFETVDVDSRRLKVAMRRIIRTPTWTVEDQKAGRPPEVGSIFTYRDETLTCHFIDGDGEIWAHDIDNNIVTPLLRDCRPIESPEEKAARLRKEWCNRAMDYSTIQQLYDAILSGELPVPVKGDE